LSVRHATPRAERSSGRGGTDPDPPSHPPHQRLPVNRDGREREDGDVDRHGLHQEDKIAQKLPENPAPGVEGVGQREGHARGAHQHVGERQVPDEEVGDVVHLLGLADDVEEQVVAEDADEDDQGVAGDDEGFEGLDELHPGELRAGVGGALQGKLVDAGVGPVPLHGCG